VLPFYPVLPLLLTGNCVALQELSFVGRVSNWQALDVESYLVLEAHLYHSWSDAPLPKKGELMRYHDGTGSLQICSVIMQNALHEPCDTSVSVTYQSFIYDSIR
jgi:hypothetical protein